MHRKTRLYLTRYIVAATTLLTVYWLFSSWTTTPRLESEALADYMSHGARPVHIAWTPKSSFNWSSVKYQHPAGELTPLPSSRGSKRLPRVQHRFKQPSAAEAKEQDRRRRQVRRLFQRDWQAYRQHAWMKDALMPLSGGFKDQFSGWAATLVDSLDTLWIMGLRDEFNEAVDAVAGIDFGHSTSGRVNTFETNIRYLGGLLAAYDLSGRKVLLAKATELGDLLYAAFNTANRMPVDFIDFERAKTGAELFVEGTVVSASPGTLSLELTRLAQATGDNKYYDAITRVMQLFANAQNATRLPGLWPLMVSMSRPDLVTGDAFSLGGGADSLYEYLPKMHGLLAGAEPMYATMTKRFLDAADRHLVFRPMTPDHAEILMAGTARVDATTGNPELDPETEHLSCYLGGTFALGGRLLRRPADVETGVRLARGCAYAYAAMASGVGPERWNTAPCPRRAHAACDCRWDEAEWERARDLRPEWKPHLPKGFTTAKDPRYILRPEAIESVFLLHRITGRPEFRDQAWAMFQAVRNATGGPINARASASVQDVTVPASAVQREDYMESFWLAETLKYFYLAFSPPDLVSLDDYVFNTEAHPFRRPK